MSLMEILWPFLFPLLGALVALVHINNEKKTADTHRKLEIILMWQLAIGLGLSLLWGGIGHLFFADQVAESIGWPTGSPFQREVGMWDAAIGIVGLLCLKYRDHFWLATIIGGGLFLFGAGLGHVYEFVAHGDISPNNIGGVLWVDLLLPVFLVVLYLLYHKEKADIHTLK
ncbi:MAG: DUF6790 family protein [Methanoregula sp.]